MKQIGMQEPDSFYNSVFPMVINTYGFWTVLPCQ